MRIRKLRGVLLGALLAALLTACGASDALVGGDALYVPDVVSKAQEYHGKEITVDGAYVERGGAAGMSVLATGISTLDNGLDAQPIGDQIWLEGVPESIAGALHQPGDAVYGMVRVRGQFEASGGYGPAQAYQYRIRVVAVEPIEPIRRIEFRVPDDSLGEGKVGLLELMRNPANYHEQTITTQGYYFWNSVIFVLAEGISTEEDGSNPQPIGKVIWMEGFPPDESGKLHLGPNNSFVWGKVEVTGQFKSGGAFGKDGKYTEFLQATSAKAIENVPKAP